MRDTVSTKILRTTRENLQTLSSVTGDEQLDIMDRAVKAEMSKPENQKKARQFVEAYNANGAKPSAKPGRGGRKSNGK